ncbi:zinc finger protein 32-like [Lytechinus pictus]|uniref:zinc finger protein 32-like n=1 Tax=Lytechinus pictus TaxID=7653 RepID=UPI0030B9AD8C
MKIPLCQSAAHNRYLILLFYSGGNSSVLSICEEIRKNEEMSGDTSCDRSHAHGLSSANSASRSYQGELTEDIMTQYMYVCGGNVGKQSSCQQKGNTQIISGDLSHGRHLPGDYPLQGTPSYSSPRGNCSSEYGSYLLPDQADYPQGQCSADSATTSNHDGERLVLDIVVGNEKYHTNSLQNTKKLSPVTATRSIQGNPGIDPKEESTFLCSVCNEGCKRKDDLKRHMIFHKGKKLHECSFCNKTFVSKANLIRHERSHTGERPYSCFICNKRFLDTSHLKAHLSIHTGEKPYECSLCNKAFSLKAPLMAHLRMHSGEKPFKCSLCKNSFSSKSNLKAHQIKHTGEKPYQCSVCEKRLWKKDSLNQHMKIHTGEKPFQCSICSKNFRQKSNLKNHMKIHEISSDDL